MHAWACFVVSVACERFAGECLRAKSTDKPYRVDCSIKRCVCGLFQRSRQFPMDKIGIYPIGPDFFPIRPIEVRLPNTGWNSLSTAYTIFSWAMHYIFWGQCMCVAMLCFPMALHGLTRIHALPGCVAHCQCGTQIRRSRPTCLFSNVYTASG